MLQTQVTLLGGFAVTVGGVPVADASWKRRHAAAVVKVLALAPGRRGREVPARPRSLTGQACTYAV